MLFDTFAKIDRKIQKNFKVLSKLIDKMNTSIYHNDQLIVAKGQILEKLQLIYQGKVQVREIDEDGKEKVTVVGPEYIIGHQIIAQRQVLKPVNFSVRAVSASVKIIEVDLEDIDIVMNQALGNNLAAFVTQVKLFMHDPNQSCSEFIQNKQLKSANTTKQNSSH